MRAVDMTVVMELTPEEHANKEKLVRSFIESTRLDDGWNWVRRRLKYEFDSNYNRYYVTLKFTKPSY